MRTHCYRIWSFSLLIVIFNLISAKFYIYPWPTNLDDVYPLPNATLYHESTYSHDFYPNSGAGKMLDGGTGLFQTWQFSLYKNIMQRLRASKYRTFNPEEATSFVIPFDCGVHSYIDHENGKKRLGSPHGWVAKMLLENSPYMQRNHGHDHFAIFSITLYQMIGIGVKMFYQEICYNCTTLVIETSPAFVTSISGWPYKNYWYAVPYPSSFHWWEGIERLPWTDFKRNQISQVNKDYGERDIFTLFIGSTRTATVSANRFRKVLQDQCLFHSNSSQTISNFTNNHSFSWCEWYTVTHSCHALINQTQLIPLYQRAVFCLAPIGDSLTRKSLFDAIVAGCIPVIFDRRSLSQYHWHVSPDILDAIAVILPPTTVSSLNATAETSFVTMLYHILSPLEIRRKQAVLAKYASTFQYALVPERIRQQVQVFEKQLLEQQQTSINKNDWIPWEPPMPDAVSVIITRLLDPATTLPAIATTSKNFLQQQYSTPSYDIPMNSTYLRYFCRYQNDVVVDGVFFSRGLAWHRLRQLCLSVGLLIQLEDGIVVDIHDPAYIQQQKDKKKAKKKSKPSAKRNPSKSKPK